MNKKDLVRVLTAIESDRASLARPYNQISLNGESVACYRIEEINDLLSRMKNWGDLLLDLIDEDEVRFNEEG